MAALDAPWDRCRCLPATTKALESALLPFPPPPLDRSSTPEPAIPTGLPVPGQAPELAVVNSIDPEGAPLTYGFRIYTDDLCTQPVLEAVDVPEGSEVTEWTPVGLSDGYYWWRAWAFDGAERSLLSEPVEFSTSGASAIGDPIILRPGLKVLTGVTGREVRLRLDLPASGPVTLDIFDTRGARIRRLHSGGMESGTRILSWDGRDGGGRKVSSGLYLIRMRYAGEKFTGRVVVVR